MAWQPSENPLLPHHQTRLFVRPPSKRRPRIFLLHHQVPRHASRHSPSERRLRHPSRCARYQELFFDLPPQIEALKHPPRPELFPLHGLAEMALPTCSPSCSTPCQSFTATFQHNLSQPKDVEVSLLLRELSRPLSPSTPMEAGQHRHLSFLSKVKFILNLQLSCLSSQIGSRLPSLLE